MNNIANFFKPNTEKNKEKAKAEEIKIEKQEPLHKPWVEKYRPNKLEEVAYQNNVINALKVTRETGKLPHLLLYGPPGTGKTSTIIALAKELYGDHDYKKRVLELNASDERGIQVVREKIKNFSQIKAQKTTEKKAPPYSLIILDEADSMTVDAQSALRRIIEDHVKTIRFCIICNYVSKIIDPISSRCAKFRFAPLTLDTQLERLQLICEKENLEISTDILKYLINIAEGDLRRSINLLQTISTFDKRLINENLINDICGIIPENFISDLFETARYQKPDIIVKKSDEFLANGYDLKQFNIQFTEFIAANKTLTDEEKSKINFLILDSEIKLLENSSQYIQLYNLLNNIRSLFSMSIN